MNDEHISALMDDELSVENSREMIAQVLAEPSAQATWGRYHLIGDALRSVTTSQAPSRQTDNIVPFPTSNPRSLPKIGLGLAAAAALAAVALIVALPKPTTGAGGQSVAVERLVPAPVSPYANDGNETLASYQPRDGGDLADIQEGGTNQNVVVKADEAQKRMNTYLFNFNEQRARQRTPGVHPYVRIVGYETP